MRSRCAPSCRAASRTTFSVCCRLRRAREYVSSALGDSGGTMHGPGGPTRHSQRTPVPHAEAGEHGPSAPHPLLHVDVAGVRDAHRLDGAHLERYPVADEPPRRDTNEGAAEVGVPRAAGGGPVPRVRRGEQHQPVARPGVPVEEGLDRAPGLLDVEIADVEVVEHDREGAPGRRTGDIRRDARGRRAGGGDGVRGRERRNQRFHGLECRDRLRPAVLPDDEVVPGEPGDRLAVAVEHDDVHRDQLGRGREPGRRLQRPRGSGPEHQAQSDAGPQALLRRSASSHLASARPFSMQSLRRDALGPNERFDLRVTAFLPSRRRAARLQARTPVPREWRRRLSSLREL